jgi:hypothetical protein
VAGVILLLRTRPDAPAASNENEKMISNSIGLSREKQRPSQ